MPNGTVQPMSEKCVRVTNRCFKRETVGKYFNSKISRKSAKIIRFALVNFYLC